LAERRVAAATVLSPVHFTGSRVVHYGGKGAGARSSPSAGIAGTRLNNWKKKHNADGTMRPGAGRRVAARTAKRRAGSPARLEASTAPCPALVAAAPEVSSRAPAKPVQHTISREETDAAMAPDPSAGIRDEDMEVDDVTKLAATCFVDAPAEVVPLVKTYKTYLKPAPDYKKLQADDAMKYAAMRFADAKKAAGY
jgi:hypothetical protein